MQKERVLLGMSGGTDSSVAAMLLLEQGFEVIGITFRLWSNSDPLENEIEPEYLFKAVNLAKTLNIEHNVIDLRADFYNKIIQYFKNEYLAGQTPNPCALCNVEFKWKWLIIEADKRNCKYVATGHYASIEWFNNKAYIKKGVDPDKEQSFFLWGLSQNVLSRAILPLGNLTKTEVKQLACDKGFVSVANTKESIGICFIHDGKYRPFLESLLKQEELLPGPGNFIDINGNILGKHNGYPFYTVGQRRGLGLEPEQPWYVIAINAKSNTVTLGKRADLFQSQMLVRDYIMHNTDALNGELITRIRYRKQEAKSIIEIIDDRFLSVKFNPPEWSIAPGQTAAFYIGEHLVGGGFIVE